MTSRVLILGGRAPAALDHARRFRRHGWDVHVADSIPCRLSGWSSAVSATHALRPPRDDPRGFAADLERIARACRIDALLPTCEEVFHVARHRARLPAALHVVADGFDTLAALHSKWTFTELARRHGLPVPDSARVQTLAQAREWADGRAVALKPEYSRFGVHVRLYPRGVPDDAPELAPTAWVVQKLLVGDELCSYGIADRGRLLAHAVYRPSYRVRRSSSYYFEPVQRPAIRDAVARFVRGIGYSGQIAFDWIETASGRALALECNPRATSGLHLFPLEADLPAALLGDGALQEPPPQARARMIAALMLSAGLQTAIRNGRVSQWLRDVRRADDVVSVPGDRLPPMAGAMADLASYARIAWRRRCNLREAATRDIEWDGEPLEGPAP